MPQVTDNINRLSGLQLELLKSLKYMATEKQLTEVRSLLRFYFAEQLDAAIEKAEADKNYSAAIYNGWLGTNAMIVKNNK